MIIHVQASTIYRRLFAGLLWIALGGSLAANYCQARRAQALPFSPGEELLYQAEFNRGPLRGVNVGELRFNVVDSVGSNGREQKLIGDAVGKGFLLKLFGSQFHLHVESIFTAEPFTVVHTNKLDEERKRVRFSEASFDHETRRAIWSDRDPTKSQTPTSTTVAFTEPVQDILTVIYFMRTRHLEPGQSFDVPLVDGGHLYRFSVAVMERKKMKTVMGRVDVLRIEPSMFGDQGLVRGRGTLSIWITEDVRHIPVKAQIKVPAGTFDIKLKQVTNRKDEIHH